MEGTEIDFVPSLFNFVLYFRLLYDNSNQLLDMGQKGFMF